MTISVVIPTWNRVQTLVRAVQSALDQTVPVLEILICDDGSTDNSQEVINSIADERISWIPGPHLGLPAVARNRGLALAKGEWIAFLDSDDEWLPNKLEIQLAALILSKAKAVCSNAFRITSASSKTAFFHATSDSVISLDALLRTNGVICSSAMIHRDLLKVVEGFPEGLALKAIEDYALWLRVACLTPILYVAEPLVNYYDNPIESIRQDDVSPLEQKMLILQDAQQWVARHKWRLSRKSKQKMKYSLNTALGIPNQSRLGNAKKFIVSMLNRL